MLVCICVFRSLFMVPTEHLHNSCHNGVIRQSHLFAHLPSDLFVFITVKHVGAKLAWSHAILWDHRLMHSIRCELKDESSERHKHCNCSTSGSQKSHLYKVAARQAGTCLKAAIGYLENEML